MADVKNTTEDDLARVKSTATDGRLANVYWRQDQLRALHGTLVQHEKEALSAIEHDTPLNTPTEAKLEYYLALSAVKQQYTSLDPQRSLDDEYRIKHGKDAADRRDPVGIVFVDPTAHTMFYSALVALAAAMAAGNCVVLQLETTTLRRVPTLLQTILKAALDPDVYAIVPTYPSSLDPSTTVQVLQNGARDKVPIRPHDVVSPTTARVLAIVDRTADVAAAARDLVAARFAFGGRSPYAPDLVLVNEFVKTAFLEAAVRETIRFLAEGGSRANGVANGDVKPRREKDDDAELADLKAVEGVRVVTSGANGAVVEIESRTSPLLAHPRKISARLLAVHAVTSLDDAIDVSNRLLSTPTSTSSTSSQQSRKQGAQEELPLAAYLFATPAYAKYLAQFVRASATHSNHVASEKLLGPAVPIATCPAWSSSPSSLYATTLFTKPHPDFAGPSALSHTISSVLSSPSSPSTSKSTSSAALLQSLATHAASPLPANRKYKKGVGFFEQGILIGLGLTAGPVLIGVVTAAWLGGRWAWGVWCSGR